MILSPARLLPLAALLSLSVYAIPAQAYEECQPPKTNYEEVYCTADSQYYIGFNSDYSVQTLLDKQGKALVSSKGYDDINFYSINEDIFAVMKNGKVGYMNTQGKLVIPTVYDSMRDPNNKYDETWSEPVSNGRILVKKNGKLGIIDTSNKVIMPFNDKYAAIKSISEGMAPVMSKSYKWGFIDKNGKEVIAPKYDGTNGHFGGVYGFSQGLAGMKKGDKWGYITKSGKVAIPFVYDEIRPFSEGVAGVLKNGKWGFINGANKTMVPFKYSDDNVERYSVNYMGASYFIFEDNVAEVATINDKTVCINKSDKKVACR
ncbi:WG repeat-containing protein [Psychrobacter jeotgali]|uniref:WG repeat-containing protein n=1 Tax=Psychrobacter jeotgali TaxID=179010 RepID=UPI00191A0C43|nr:WG repeat-containing protein [Psychrobacter jeotgali]